MLVLLAALGAASPAAAQDGGAWSCEASALRGTVLGTSIEPIVANVGAATCAARRSSLVDTADLPVPLTATAISAATALTGQEDARARDRRAIGVGSVSGLRVSAANALPLADIVANVPPLDVLGLVQLDLRPALQALLQQRLLADLVSVDALTSYAFGTCVDGRPQLGGASTVTGLRVLGQPLGADQAVSQVVNLLNTTSIDASELDLTKIELPVLGPLVLPLVQAALQPALDALPPIAIPEALAHVAVTPAEQTRADGVLTQRALRVQVSLLGQSLVDLVLGEAVAGERAVSCAADAAGPSATELALGCTTRKLTLIDVVPDGRRVRFLGAADKSLAGEEVDIVLEATNDVVASPTVRPDGSFSASAPLPSRSVRSTDRARYVAKVGRQRSLNLKLERRMQVTGISTEAGVVTIAGRVTGPLARRAKDREVVVTRRLTCKRYEVVGRGMPRSDGTFRLRVPAPKGERASVYRLRSKVQKTAANRKLFPTFTLPRAVDLL